MSLSKSSLLSSSTYSLTSEMINSSDLNMTNVITMDTPCDFNNTNVNNDCFDVEQYSNQLLNSEGCELDCCVNQNNNQNLIENNAIVEELELHDIDQSVINESDEIIFDNLFLTDEISYFKKV